MTPRSRVLGAVTIIAASALCGCVLRNTPRQSSRVDSAVTSEQWQRAQSIMTGIDYLPWRYLPNGCHARAFYVALELAAVGIPTSFQYLVPADGTLTGPGGEPWNYHVAPMFWIENAPEPTIVDPSFAALPLPRTKWQELVDPRQDEALTRHFTTSTTLGFPGPASAPVGPATRAMLEGDFSTLRPYRASDVSFACRLMEVGIELEPDAPPADVDAKTARLRAATARLIRSLNELKLLDGGESHSGDASCY